MSEETLHNIRVVLRDYPPKVFEKAEYYVTDNRTLCIFPHPTEEQIQNAKCEKTLLASIATYNRDTWLYVEVVKVNNDPA
jgi:hypothetical protein